MDEKALVEIIFKLRSDVWEIWGFSSVISVTAIGWLISTKGLKTKGQKLLASLLYSSFYITMIGSFLKAYCELEMAVSDLNKFGIAPLLNYKGGFLHHLYNIEYFNHFWYAAGSNTFMASIFMYCIWGKLLNKL